MDKKNKNPNVPNLRFSFEEDWCTSTIGENFRLSSGLTPSTKEKAYFNNGIIPWINSGELKNKYISFTENKLTLDAVKKHNLTIYPIDTMVIAIYGLEAAGVRGKASITKMDSTISQSCMAFNSLGNVLTQFMYYVYKKEAQILGTRYAQGTKQQNLSSDLLSSYKLLYPSKEEQLKIVNFLSLIDEKIETQSKIIEDYKVLKKKISKQVIGSQKPNTHIYECLENNSSSSKESDFDEYTEGQFPIYGANGVIKHINSYLIDIPSISIVKDGAGVGRTRFLYGKYTVIGTLNYLTSKNGYDLLYLYYALDNLDFTKYIVGSGIPHIYFKDYKREMIYIPKDEKTINKIVRCLSSLDLLIHNEQNLLLYLTKQKEYLLNNMFI